MPIRTDLDSLDMAFQEKAAALLGRLREDPVWRQYGYKPMVVETRRDLAVQMAYYSRSRMNPTDVRLMFEAAGLWRISESEARIPSTWTLKSKHLTGRAMDLAPSKDGFTPDWGAPDEVWRRVGHYAGELGLKCGGDWSTTPDRPHVEMV